MIGFIGAPWTLAAYAVEGGHSKLCTRFKRMCLEQPHLAHALLEKLTDSLCVYASHQVCIFILSHVVCIQSVLLSTTIGIL